MTTQKFVFKITVSGKKTSCNIANFNIYSQIFPRQLHVGNLSNYKPVPLWQALYIIRQMGNDTKKL
jgi:hypothetical protein